MGVNRLIVWAALALTACFGFAFAGPLDARTLLLGNAVCTAGATSAEAAFAIPEARLDCNETRVPLSQRFARARIELDKLGLVPPGRLIWQTDPTSFDSMLIRLDFADGSQRLIDVDAQMAVRNWDANGNFWVPIQQQGGALVAIDVVVERPHSSAVFSRMMLSSFEEAAGLKYNRTLLYVLICGILLVPIIYDLFFYRILRARFMIWHLGMTFGTLLYVLFNTGLILLAAPNLESGFRFGMIFVAMALTIVGAAQFTLKLLEEDKVSLQLRSILLWAVTLNLVLSGFILLDIEVLRAFIVDAYLLSIFPVIFAFLAVLAAALRRGSRAAVFLFVAYSGLILTGVIEVLAVMGLWIWTSLLIDETIYGALVLLVIGSSAAVGDRFLIIKGERDRARHTALKLGAMANSDGLTGLLNRRAFDQVRRLGKGRALLLADIDRFKVINDTFGHQRGDAVLCHAARVIEQVVDRSGGGDVYRLGGEEFAVVTPPTSKDELRGLAEGIRAGVSGDGDREAVFDMPNITISIGAVMGDGQAMHVAFADADGALYRAKAGGRNRCEFVES